MTVTGLPGVFSDYAPGLAGEVYNTEHAVVTTHHQAMEEKAVKDLLDRQWIVIHMHAQVKRILFHKKKCINVFLFSVFNSDTV